MPNLILIRGIPGSGKSTIAKSLFPNYQHHEADNYFLNENNIYQYDKSKIHLAHQDCFNKVKNDINNNLNVVCSNTFIKKSYMIPYLNLNANTFVIIANGNYKDIHNVPIHTINKMYQDFEF